MEPGLDRRAFLAAAGAGALAVALEACGGGGGGAASTATRATTRGATPPPPRPRPLNGAAALRDLRRSVQGPLLTPGQPGFAAAAEVYNERYDAVRPQAVLIAQNERDVAAAVAWAARNEQHIVARSGGHSYAGYSTTEKGVVVDLRRLSAISVQRGSGAATIGAGSQLIDVYSKLAAAGATIPAGSCPSVGIGGHAQGGGFGLASRAFGLVSDNVQAVRIVTADGQIRTASQGSDPDLYWACRGGGGGNFGIVTGFHTRVHPVRNGSYFFVNYPWSQASAAMDAWQRWAPHASPQATSTFHLSTGSGSPSASVSGQWLGAPGALSAALAPLRAVSGASVASGQDDYMGLVLRFAGCLNDGLPACHTVGTSPGGTLARARFVAKSDYIARPLPTAGRAAYITAIEQRQNNPQGGSGAILFDSYGGVIDDVAPDATAFVHRRVLCAVQYLAYYGDAEAAGAWTLSAWKAAKPFVSGAAYQNYIDPDLNGWAQAYYGANLPRLRAVKQQYDPGFLFRFPQAIPPA